MPVGIVDHMLEVAYLAAGIVSISIGMPFEGVKRMERNDHIVPVPHTGFF